MYIYVYTFPIGYSLLAIPLWPMRPTGPAAGPSEGSRPTCPPNIKEFDTTLNTHNDLNIFSNIVRAYFPLFKGTILIKMN